MRVDSASPLKRGSVRAFAARVESGDYGRRVVPLRPVD